MFHWFILAWVAVTLIVAFVKPQLCAAFGGSIPLLNLIAHRIRFNRVLKWDEAVGREMAKTRPPLPRYRVYE